MIWYYRPICQRGGPTGNACYTILCSYMLHTGIIRDEHTEKKTLDACRRNDTGKTFFLFLFFSSSNAAILKRKVSMFGSFAPFLPIDFFIVSSHFISDARRAIP